jgi:uncharacterized protein (DUF2236 family)
MVSVTWPVDAVRGAVRHGLGSLFSSARFPQEQYTDPPGDPGLFGPDSVTWKVHADVSMFVGGITALMVQTLHPRAAAGVAEHSRYREDPMRRLSRTGSFVAGTTYGSTPVAESMIKMVQGIHHRVQGVAPDGAPYSAQDPDLLRWIHVAEVTSFLRAYRRYALLPVPMRGDEIDRYYAETAVVAVKLGATDVPTNRGEVHDYLVDVRRELRVDAYATEMMAFLRQPIDHDPVTRAVHGLLIQAGIGLLPRWAQDLHGVRMPPLVHDLSIRPATFGLFEAMRLALGPSPVLEQARRRATAVPAG